MKINQVQINATDPKAKTPIDGVITAILGQETVAMQSGQQLLKQTVVCDGVTAAFWPGRGQPLTQADLNKPMQLMCKASVYQNMMQYSLSRPTAGFGGRKSPADYTKDRQTKNRGVALSYALEHLKLPLPQAYEAAKEMYEFIENGNSVAPPQPVGDAVDGLPDRPPPVGDDDIPF